MTTLLSYHREECSFLSGSTGGNSLIRGARIEHTADEGDGLDRRVPYQAMAQLRVQLYRYL
jgi:hypothetical protein